ncbi:MAG: hypothetical protein WEB52_00535 [Dehalococcoidia bacterium]
MTSRASCLHRSLLARAVNRIEPRATAASADSDVVRREFLFIDVDPTRASGISSTAEERDSAQALLREVVAFLTGAGWPEPVICMSGNGFYALYRVDLPNDSAAMSLVKAVLESLAERFNTDAAHVDTSVFNAARSRGHRYEKMKGDATLDRPHRRSGVVSVPDSLVAVTSQQLEQIVPGRSAPKSALCRTSHKRSG